jgi:hypothetical protein
MKALAFMFLRTLTAILIALVIFPVLLLPSMNTVPRSIQILFAVAEVAWLVAMSRLSFSMRIFLVKLAGF